MYESPSCRVGRGKPQRLISADLTPPDALGIFASGLGSRHGDTGRWPQLRTWGQPFARAINGALTRKSAQAVLGTGTATNRSSTYEASRPRYGYLEEEGPWK